MNTTEIINRLESDEFLPNKRKIEIISILNSIPHDILVIDSLSDISVDFSLEISSKLYFYELHESQHRTLSVKRPSRIYSLEGKVIFVPRFIQRFLRDIWRIKYLPNYKIIWADWFEKNHTNFIFNLNSDFVEYCLPDKFSFSKLLNVHGRNN
jgi:hypothetical protein